MVTVLDKDPPTISCSTNIVVDTDPGERLTSTVTDSSAAPFGELNFIATSFNRRYFVQSVI